MNKSEGYVPFKGNKTYYKIVGKPSKKKCPLLVLHGGPASAHNYLLGLGELAKNGHQVIFYDQLGCGLSDHPDDDSLWTIQTFLEELSTIRKELKLDTIHLLGHSWGGILAIEYLLTQPDGVKSTKRLERPIHLCTNGRTGNLSDNTFLEEKCSLRN